MDALGARARSGYILSLGVLKFVGYLKAVRLRVSFRAQDGDISERGPAQVANSTIVQNIFSNFISPTPPFNFPFYLVI